MSSTVGNTYKAYLSLLVNYFPLCCEIFQNYMKGCLFIKKIFLTQYFDIECDVYPY